MLAVAKRTEDDADDFTGEPPTREENERADQVQIICDLLAQASRRENFEWSISGAMESTDRRSRDIDRVPISVQQRDKLLTAVVQAHAAASEYLARWLTPWFIDHGFGALGSQVMLMAESSQQSSLRDAGRIADIHARARIFRNYMHNLSLAQEMSDRAFVRRSDCIQEMLRVATDATAQKVA